jgi:hypothetical protein
MADKPGGQIQAPAVPDNVQVFLHALSDRACKVVEDDVQGDSSFATIRGGG